MVGRAHPGDLLVPRREEMKEGAGDRVRVLMVFSPSVFRRMEDEARESDVQWCFPR